MSLDDRQLRDLNKLIQALDAKINAVAAYVAAMPGASDVDKSNVAKILRGHRWTPQSPFSPPSPTSMATTVISAIAEAAATRADASGEMPGKE